MSFQYNHQEEAFAFGSSLYGGRPTFALTRSVDQEGEPSLTLHELLPREQAEARKERLERVNRHLKIVPIEEALVPVAAEELTGDSWKGWVTAKVTRLSGSQFTAVLDLVREALTGAEIEPTPVVSGGEGSVLLPEAVGIRLALGFLGLKPIRRIDRQRAFARGIARMSTEECYYWHARCRSPSSPNGTKALRVLLTDHIQ